MFWRNVWYYCEANFFPEMLCLYMFGKYVCYAIAVLLVLSIASH